MGEEFVFRAGCYVKHWIRFQILFHSSQKNRAQFHNRTQSLSCFHLSACSSTCIAYLPNKVYSRSSKAYLSTALQIQMSTVRSLICLLHFSLTSL